MGISIGFRLGFFVCVAAYSDFAKCYKSKVSPMLVSGCDIMNITCMLAGNVVSVV